MAEFCTSCGGELTPGARFCASCGAATAIGCVKCGAELPSGAAFCPACGTSQDTGRPVELGANEELRVISAVFADLAGFTADTERADPEDTRARLQVYHGRVRADVERHGGSVEKLMGDGVFAVFGVPDVHEDDAERAVRAALRIQESVDELNERDAALALAVRIGVTTGEAIVQLGDDVSGERIVGDVVNTASRLEGVAAPGSVVIDERTHQAVHASVECVALEPVSVKGKAAPLRIWRATEARSRFGVGFEETEEAVFVGREAEHRLIADAFERAIDRRKPQLVTISGEAGVGKSRLVREFFDTIDDRPELVRWRQGRSLPYGDDGVTFWALAEIVKSEAGILETESADRGAVKLAVSISTLAEGVEHVDEGWLRSRLAPLAGTGSAEGVDRGELFSAWLRYFELLAAKTPLVAVIEDLHWADDALADFIEHILDWGEDAPILIVCTARPEWHERRPGWGGGQREAVNVGLAPLSQDETGQLVTALASRTSLPDHVNAALLEYSGGNPLYLTEYVRLATEEGWFDAVRAGADLPLPDSVHAILAARLDRLDPADKSAIQAAAVVGKVFWSGAVSFLRSVGEDAARQSLHRMARRELIQPVRRSSMEGQEEYSFTHVLARDVAYGQLPRGEKARLHRETARWLEVVSAGRLVDVAELLAHHHTTALELEPSDDSELLEHVYRVLTLAGERTMSLDLDRARRFYRKAGEVATDAASRARALLEAGRQPTGNRKETTDILTEAIALFEDLGDQEHLADALSQRASVHWWGGKKAQATEDNDRAMTVIEDLPPSKVVAEVMVSQAFRHQLGGQEELALEGVERAMAVAKEIGDTGVYAKALRARGSSLIQMGVNEGIDDVRESLRVDLDRGNTLDVMSSYNAIATHLGYIGDVTEAIQVIDEAIAYGEQRGAGPSVEWSKMTKCESLVQIGDIDEVARLADELAEADEQRGGTQVGIFARQFWAWSSWARGDAEGAWEAQQWVAEESYNIDDPQVMVPNLAHAIEFARAAGCLDEAMKYLDDFIEVAAANPAFVPMHIRRAAPGLIAAGRAAELSSVLSSAITTTSWEQALLSSAEALILEADGRPAEALERLLPAIEEADRRGIHFEATSLRVDAARCALAAGRDDLANELIQAAREMATRMGAEIFVDAVDRIDSARLDEP